MGWPDNVRLGLKAEAAFGADLSADPATWIWTDLSSRLEGLGDQRVTIRRGRSRPGADPDPMSATVTLGNTDGALTPLQPMSTYWPYVVLNTPVRLSLTNVGASPPYIRFTGFADQWQPTFVPNTDGEMVSAVTLTASGITRRLSQGIALRSAPVRYFQLLNGTLPVAYWPLEDGALAAVGKASIGSYDMQPFVGTHPSGAVITYPQWGQGNLGPWLPPVVGRSGTVGLTVLWARVSMPSFSGAWSVEHLYASGTDAAVSTVDINPSYLPGGSIGWPQMTIDPANQLVSVALNGEPEVDAAVAGLFDGLPHCVQFSVYQDGAKVSWFVRVDNVSVNSGTTTGNMTLAAVTTIGAAAAAGGGMASAHYAVWDILDPANAEELLGHPTDETVAGRLIRLGDEEGFGVGVTSGGEDSVGPQSTAAIMDLLRDAADVDGGMVVETLDPAAVSAFLTLRSRVHFENGDPALIIDLSTYRTTAGTSAAVLAPTYDDKLVRNYVEVSRVDGGTAVAYDAAHIAAHGLYDTQVALNVGSDDQLADQAAWRTHLGSVNLPRFPTTPLDLGANPTLIDAWLACDLASRVLRTNPPAVYSPDDVDVVIEGYAETLRPKGWTVDLITSPFRPWQVFTLAATSGDTDDFLGHLDWDTCVTAEALDTTETGVDVTTTPLLTTVADDFPIDILIGGERMTVTNCTGASNPQTLTVTRSVNGVVKSHSLGATVELHPDSACYLGL